MKILVYDLPSENYKIFPAEIKERVRNIRVKSIYYLHKLGVLSTESVILIPDINVDKVDSTIEKVYNLYNNLKSDFPEFSEYFDPIIKLLNATEEQKEQLITIAYNNLKRAIDEAVERISSILEIEIAEEKRKNIFYALSRASREWSDIWERARNLGINLDSEFEYLINLIDNVKEGITE